MDDRDRFGKGRKAGNLLRDIMAGVELNAPHREVILAVANSLRSLGADLVLGEAAVVTSTLRRGYSYVDLVASYAGLTWGFEVDWKTIKWRSIQKLMSYEHDVSVFVLRHPRPNLQGSLARLKLILGRG